MDGSFTNNNGACIFIYEVAKDVIKISVSNRERVSNSWSSYVPKGIEQAIAIRDELTHLIKSITDKDDK